ncbi:hypothetical protein BH23GEM3_BH23GEM3_08660 [soil metagenome]
MGKRNGRRNGAGTGDLVTDAVKGAIAGAIGLWALDKVTWAMWDRTDPAKLRQEEQEARPGGLDPAHVIANRVAEAAGTELTPKQPHPAGIAVHYGLGVGPGAAYGALRHKLPALATGGGTLFGLGLFLIQDEGLNPIIGTSGGPTEYPMEAHVRGLVGHLVFGAAMHASLKLMDQVI